MEKPLKSKNMPFIVTFILFQTSFLYFFSLPDFNFNNFLTEDFFKKGSMVSLIIMFSFIFNSILSRNIKNTLVYWKLKNPLPGFFAFSRYAHEDSRIDIAALTSLHGELPIKATEQNKLWYKIFKKHEKKTSVKWAHQQWLLTRDFTALSFILFIVSIPAHILLGTSSKHLWLYYSILLGLHFIITISARNNGKAFVTAPLAEESIQQT